MKSKKSLFVNIVLFLTATLVGLLFAEILFRYKDGQPLRGELPFLQGKVDPHAKEKIDWIAMEIAKERNTNPAITGL